MNSIVLFLCIGIATAAIPTRDTPRDDLFSSIAKMEALVHQENTIVNLLDDFLKAAKNRLDIIER